MPKYLLLENVKNLVGKKFISQFNDWIQYLDSIGYDTYWQVLNAKDYGIPQNRERVFAVSIRKDLHKTFKFPEKENLKLSLADILEDEVPESFYISDEKASKLFEQISNKKISNTIRTGGRGSYDRHTWDLVAIKEATAKGYATAGVGDSINIEQPNSKTRRGRVGRGVAQTLTTSPQQVVIAASRGRYVENPTDTEAPTQQKLELNFTGCSNTITTVQKDNLVVEGAKIYQLPRGNNKGGIKEIAPTVTSNFYEHNNVLIQVPGNLYNENNPQAGSVYDPKGISPCLDTMNGGNRQPKVIDSDGECNIRIRRLTPLECWRLMGFDDDDFYKAQNSGVSNTQLYKQAGNSIVVNVLEKIFEELLKE